MTLNIPLYSGSHWTLKMKLKIRMSIENVHLLQELKLCHKILIFKSLYLWNPMSWSSVGLNNLNLKYQRLTTSGFKDIGIRQFVAKTQYLHQTIIFWHLFCPQNYISKSSKNWTKQKNSFNVNLDNFPKKTKIIA